MQNIFGQNLLNRRKALGLTQEQLAAKLKVSFQAVSKWERGETLPDIKLLPALASQLGTSADSLLGYEGAAPATIYEERYRTQELYWGGEPNEMCYDILRLLPPTRPLKVLDIGCGEGKDMLFLARCGYLTTGFDIAASGIAKAKNFAAKAGLNAEFFRADMLSYAPTEEFDILFASGVLHYLPPQKRRSIIETYQSKMPRGSLCALNVFVDKPFIKMPPDEEIDGAYWQSGELFTLFSDWKFHRCEQVIFDCNSGGVPHQHCMDILIAQKM